MAVDYLSSVSGGWYSAATTNQVGINALACSWGLLTLAGSGIEFTQSVGLGLWNPYPRLERMFQRIKRRL